MKCKSKSRTSFEEITETINKTINSPKFLQIARKRVEDFTRKRKMPFPKLIIFMLNMIKSSIQTCLDNFFDMSAQGDIHMTQQSFSEARQKIRWEAFRELFKVVVNRIYKGYYETWHGYRVMAIDGTKVQLPDDEQLREYFGTMGKGACAATGQASALYDVYNNVLIDAQLEPMSTGERQLALRHIDELCNLASFDKECILFDRGYASFEWIENLIARNIHFVMRVRTKFNTHIDELALGDHVAVLRQKAHKDIRVRVLKFLLPSGEIEMLITDISDKRMGIKAFKALYFKRWPVETKYNEIKNKLEVENFSGLTKDAVMQDFFITMFMSNVVAIACGEVQPDIDAQRESKDNKYSYHANVNHAIGTLKDRFILAMLEPDQPKREKKVNHILYLLKQRVAPTRPDRSLPRNPSPRKAKFHHNKKSNCR